MKKRKYPKVVQVYLATSTPAGYGERFKREVVVWSDTEYNSFVNHNTKYNLKERPIKWKDLPDKNFFSRIYYTFPIGITYSVGVVFGFALGHMETIIKYGKEIYRMIFR